MSRYSLSGSVQFTRGSENKLVGQLTQNLENLATTFGLLADPCDPIPTLFRLRFVGLVDRDHLLLLEGKVKELKKEYSSSVPIVTINLKLEDERAEDPLA